MAEANPDTTSGDPPCKRSRMEPGEAEAACGSHVTGIVTSGQDNTAHCDSTGLSDMVMPDEPFPIQGPQDADGSISSTTGGGERNVTRVTTGISGNRSNVNDVQGACALDLSAGPRSTELCKSSGYCQPSTSTGSRSPQRTNSTTDQPSTSTGDRSPQRTNSTADKPSTSTGDRSPQRTNSTTDQPSTSTGDRSPQRTNSTTDQPSTSTGDRSPQRTNSTTDQPSTSTGDRSPQRTDSTTDVLPGVTANPQVPCETSVGITEYISTHEGFQGVIKQRYSDFLVNEINSDGEVVRLTDLTEPQLESQATVEADDTLTETWKEQLKELLESRDKSKDVMMEVGENKSERASIHKAIREQFKGLESSTVKVNDKTCIKVTMANTKGHNRRREWPSGQEEFCKFVLYKENKDTMEALFLLSKKMRMKPGAFTFAGTKDRRGKTCQDVTVYRVPAKDLHRLNRSLRNVALGNFRYCKQQLKLGDLKGNHFVIILRNVTGNTDQIEAAIESLKDVGFINYYGMQRFGTTTVSTHQVGRALLQGKWQEAVDLILTPRAGDQEDVAAARQAWVETRDPKAALEKLGTRHCIERQLLLGLAKYNKNDLVSALHMIPRNSRMMYVHSHQSYIWNSLVSRRVREYGLKPIVGDLVVPQGTEEHLEAEDRSDGDKRKVEPLVLTSDNVSNYSIQNVVMPLPGWDVKYPDNATAQWYKDMLTEEGLDINQLKTKVKDFSLPGDYRHIVVKPGNVDWQLYQYDDVTVPLVQSDYDKLNTTAPILPTEGKFQALKLELSLPTSVYATMAIREVLKTDTSAGHQSTLNVT